MGKRHQTENTALPQVYNEPFIFLCKAFKELEEAYPHQVYASSDEYRALSSEEKRIRQSKNICMDVLREVWDTGDEGFEIALMLKSMDANDPLQANAELVLRTVGNVFDIFDKRQQNPGSWIV